MYYLPRIISRLRLKCIKHSQISRGAKICGGCMVYDSVLGPYSYIGDNTRVINASIGKFCCISEDCIIGGGAHPIHFVGMSPLFHEGRNIFRKNFAQHAFNPYTTTEIGHDVWIGHGAMIKGGVKISTGAVIGMGAVVTHDVGPYEVWGGNPARLIKKRFDEDTIKRLLASEWWEMDEKSIKAVAHTFNDPDLFLSTIKA